MKPRQQRLSDQLSGKILFGIRKAVLKLIEQRAAENSTLVVLVNGKPSEVPAKELLRKHQDRDL